MALFTQPNHTKCVFIAQFVMQYTKASFYIHMICMGWLGSVVGCVCVLHAYQMHAKTAYRMHVKTHFHVLHDNTQCML